MLAMLGGSLVIMAWHGMACPQVADGGSPPGMEGSCKYIE